MKNIIQKISQITAGILLLGMAVSSAHAFTSMYVFGDALSTTTNNTSGLSQYYGKRYSNGRVWVEVLAQRQGIPIAMNWSYFDCNSGNLWANVQRFSITSSLASNALFVIWCNNSDLFDETLNGNTNITEWTAAINRGQINHFRAITNLYSKGVRTLLMPSAVDVSRVPEFNNSHTLTNWIRLECIAYNNAFSNTLNQARAACPGLTIYEPDFFSLLNDALAHAANYGLTNTLANGTPIDAMDALNYGFPAASTNGYGTNYIFWDYLDPTAKFHEIIADLTQQIISPVQIADIIALSSSNQLVVANVPMGLNGTIEVCTNLNSPNWMSLQPVSSFATAQSYFVPIPVPAQQVGSKNVQPHDITPPGPGGTINIIALQFYRMHYSYAWNWP